MKMLADSNKDDNMHSGKIIADIQRRGAFMLGLLVSVHIPCRILGKSPIIRFDDVGTRLSSLIVFVAAVNREVCKGQ